ncbi:MAG: deoxyribonuclease IV [Synergistaceae bacterium]|jgi:deoxyribonuclease-4|nr:deoxyribonuclease IV [Synergistaceae bacterium]
MSLLGAHISVSGGLHRAIDRAQALGCEAIQIFTRNPLQWRGKSLSEGETGAFRRALLASGVKSVISHASYLINLAGDEHVRRRSVDALKAEIERCYQLGIDAVVLHPGSSKNEDPALARNFLAASLERVLSDTDGFGVPILLETMAGQGGVLGSTIEELAWVMEALDWDPRLGMCADLCHLFGAGLEVGTEGGYERLISSISLRVGLERVKCWHISDNKGARGGRMDRHAHLGEGGIGTVPFGILVADARFRNTPVILETPKDGIGDAGNLALLRKLRGSW